MQQVLEREVRARPEVAHIQQRRLRAILVCLHCADWPATAGDQGREDVARAVEQCVIRAGEPQRVEQPSGARADQGRVLVRDVVPVSFAEQPCADLVVFGARQVLDDVHATPPAHESRKSVQGAVRVRLAHANGVGCEAGELVVPPQGEQDVPIVFAACDQTQERHADLHRLTVRCTGGKPAPHRVQGIGV